MPHLIVGKEKMDKIKNFLARELPKRTAFVLMVCETDTEAPLAQFAGNTDKAGALMMVEGFKNSLDNGGIIQTPNSN